MKNLTSGAPAQAGLAAVACNRAAAVLGGCRQIVAERQIVATLERGYGGVGDDPRRAQMVRRDEMCVSVTSSGPEQNQFFVPISENNTAILIANAEWEAGS